MFDFFHKSKKHKVFYVETHNGGCLQEFFVVSFFKLKNF